MKTVLAVLLGSAVLIYGVHANACNDAACDLNGDGVGAKLPDYAIFLSAFGSKVGDAKYNAKADLDGSGTITTQDFALLQKFCPLK